MDGRPNRKKKKSKKKKRVSAFSSDNGYRWTGPKRNVDGALLTAL